MRWIVRSAVALVLLVLLGAGAVFLIPAEKIAGLAISRFNTLTGRELTIEGAVRPSFWPNLGVKTGPVRISNAEWSDEGPMLRAEGLAISIDMAALIGGEVKIIGIEAISPRIVLERSATGAENWVFGAQSGGTVSRATPGVGAPFTLDQGEISGGTLVFIDHASQSRTELTGITASVAIPDYIGEARLDMTAVMNGQGFGLKATVGAFQKFLDGRVVPLDLTLTAGAADASFKGRAGHDPLNAEGDLVADLGDLAAISALAGAQAPGLPEGLGARSVTVAGVVTVTSEAAVFLRGGKVGLDGNALAVEADLATAGARPKVTASVTAGALTLPAAPGGGVDGGAAAAGWPRDAIDASGLGSLDAEVALTADSLDLGLVKLGPTQMLVTVERARAVFDIRKVVAYSGTIAGQFVVNARNGLSVGGDLGFAGMALQPLLADFGGYERLIGSGDLRVKFLGVGNSVDAIMQGLEGSGSVALTKGEIRGVDIAGMLQNMDPSFVGEGQKTIFDSLGGSFVIAGGVLRNDDLVLASPFITATGAGDVGLGARDLEYRIRATALFADQATDDPAAGGLTAPLLIKGPWANPEFSLDLQALADEKLAEERAKLEAQLQAEADAMAAEAQARIEALEAEARANLEAELGIVPQAGESLEDAATRRANEVLEDEARKALERILNGGN